MPDHAWLDRVIRGRVWIPLLGVLLVGIVAAQVEILKLGASVGRSLEQTTTLTTQNEQLRGTVAQLADDKRIEGLAATMGFVLPPPGAVGYLPVKPGGDVTAALGHIHAPDAAAFVALVHSNGALVTGPGTSTLPPPEGTPAPPPSTTSSASSTSGVSASPSSQSSAAATSASTSSSASGSGVSQPSATQATTASSQSPPTSSQSAATSTPSSATTQQAATTTASPTQASATPATGAAAIQPTGSSQPSGGG